ncbi:hypothetical protein KKF84_05215, partial [Myxococcota bacterium]|nr:hypothetical protein [Myxococcota bacterium]MBU1534697.1 hypothetical protein [Myxococcota bacterium]
VCCFVSDNTVYTAHVGDSRAYLLRQGVISLITEDHTVVQDLVRAGYVTSEDAAYHPSSGILTKCLGQMEISDPEFSKPITLQEGDRLLLCSDGLSGMLDDDEMAEIMFHEDQDNAARIMVEMANEAGGFDNITLIHYAHGDYQEDPKLWPIKVGRPLYEDEPPPSTEEPTVPFKLKSKKDGQLRDTLILTALSSPDMRKKKESQKLLPIIIAVMVILLGLVVWYFGGVGI